MQVHHRNACPCAWFWNVLCFAVASLQAHATGEVLVLPEEALAQMRCPPWSAEGLCAQDRHLRRKHRFRSEAVSLQESRALAGWLVLLESLAFEHAVRPGSGDVRLPRASWCFVVVLAFRGGVVVASVTGPGMWS